MIADVIIVLSVNNQKFQHALIERDVVLPG